MSGFTVTSPARIGWEHKGIMSWGAVKRECPRLKVRRYSVWSAVWLGWKGMPMPALPSEQRRQHRSRAQTERTERAFEISVSYLLLFAFLSLFWSSVLFCDRRGSDGVRWMQFMRGFLLQSRLWHTSRRNADWHTLGIQASRQLSSASCMALSKSTK